MALKSKSIFRKCILLGTVALAPLAFAQSASAQVPANPTDICTFNWNVWRSGGPDDNPGGGNQRLNPALRVFNVDGSWYSTAIPPNSNQNGLGDNVAPAQITGNNSEWERMYGVGYFPMEPGTTQTINIDDNGTFDGHVVALFDSAGNQFARFPDLADGQYYGSSGNASHVAAPGILVGAAWNDSFEFTVPADGDVYLHYIWADEDNIGRFLTSDGCRTTDLVTVKSLPAGDPSLVMLGDTVTYEILVTNNGGVDATNITLTDSLPTGLTPVSGNGAVTNGTYNAGTGEWIIPALTEGASATLTLVGTVNSDQAGQIIENITTGAEGDQFDPTTDGDTLEASVTVNAMPSLSMTKVADNLGPHKAGDVVTYTYTITNDGDVIVNDVAINDTHNGSDPAPVPGNETLTDNGTLGDSTDAAVDGSWDVLAPGDVVTFTGTYTVTQADVDNL